MIPFIGMLFKGRKSEGPNTEHRPIAITPDGAAKVELTTATSPVFPGALPPADVSGQSLWLNTNAGMEGLYFFDLARGKWLETTLITRSWGEDVADNKILSPVGVENAGLGAGYPAPQNLTLVGVAAHTRTGNLAKGIEVRADGATVLLSFALSGGNFENMNLNVDVAGGGTRYLDAFAVAAGASATDLSVDAFFRRRGT
jgi:hypothetical protein